MSQTEVQIVIGGRSFDVACQVGEEQYLHAAAALLDTEAQVLVSQIGRMPETRLLLMAGLMLADKTAGLEEKLRASEEKLAASEQMVAALRNAPAPQPDRVEVPVIPDSVTDTLSELAARAEAMATEIEEKVQSA